MANFQNIEEAKKYFIDLRLMHSATWNSNASGFGQWWDEDEERRPYPTDEIEARIPRLPMFGTSRCIFTAGNITIGDEKKTVQLYDGFDNNSPTTFMAVNNGNSTVLLVAEIIPILKWTFIGYDEESDEQQYAHDAIE